jgi:hypothetical protein
MEKKMKEEILLMLEMLRNNTILSKSPLPNPCGSFLNVEFEIPNLIVLYCVHILFRRRLALS